MARVLVVDDSPQVRALVRMTLALEGHEVLEAAEAVTAWQVMIAHQPDVVILDVTMPAVNGLDLCRAMRDDPELGAMPVIVLTGRGLPDDEATAIGAGADHFLAKPFSPKHLIAAVNGLAGEA